MSNFPNKIPRFVTGRHDQDTINKIQNTEWEVRKERILAVKKTNIVLMYGTRNEGPLFQHYADIHNGNLLVGITDIEYNNSLIEYDVGC